MWFVYILLCANNSLYTGIAKDPHERFQNHVAGRGGHYTRAFRPTKIVYTETHTSRSEALKREWQIKRWTRVKKMTELGLKI